MRVAILVTHLLGTGHLARALALGRAVGAAGGQAIVLSGGPPAPHLSAAGVDLLQLPPVRSDGIDFTTLLTPAGDAVDPAYLRARREAVEAAFAQTAPDALVVELWPFGRRVLSEEFEAAIAAFRQHRPTGRVYGSIRDILAAPSKPERIAQTAERVARLLDKVLAHSDPALVPLEASWPGGGRDLPAEIAARLVYTGFIAHPPPPDDGGEAGRGEILVTAGGGPVGQRLFEAAIEASRLGGGPVWRLLVGGGAQRLATLRARAEASPAPRLLLEAARPDYRSLLRRAACSVSQVGYNTALDLLTAQVPSVLTPFAEGGETEQSLRASLLSARAGAVSLAEADVTPETLAAAVAAAQAAGPLRPPPLALDGAARSAQIILEISR